MSFSSSVFSSNSNKASPFVPGQVGRPFDDIVAFQRADRQVDDVSQLKGPGDLRKVNHDIVVAVLRITDEIHLVDRNDDMGNIEQGRDDGVTAGLFHDAVTGVDEDDNEISVGGAGDHVARILDMTRGISDDEFTPGRGEIFICNVDGDALLAFGAQPICQKGEVDLSVLFVAALAFESLQLVGQDALAIVEEAADQGAFPVVYAACSYESE